GFVSAVVGGAGSVLVASSPAGPARQPRRPAVRTCPRPARTYDRQQRSTTPGRSYRRGVAGVADIDATASPGTRRVDLASWQGLHGSHNLVSHGGGRPRRDPVRLVLAMWCSVSGGMDD